MILNKWEKEKGGKEKFFFSRRIPAIKCKEVASIRNSIFFNSQGNNWFKHGLWTNVKSLGKESLEVRMFTWPQSTPFRLSTTYKEENWSPWHRDLAIASLTKWSNIALPTVREPGVMMQYNKRWHNITSVVFLTKFSICIYSGRNSQTNPEDKTLYKSTSIWTRQSCPTREESIQRENQYHVSWFGRLEL